MCPPDTNAYDTRAIDSGVQTCPPCHWFKIELVHSDKGKPRPKWWPKEKLKGYPGEKMSITLAGVGPKQVLDGAGKFDAQKLPGGDATVQFADFYKDVESALDAGRKF